MHIASALVEGRATWGLVANGQLLPARALSDQLKLALPPTLLEFIQAGPDLWQGLAAGAREIGGHARSVPLTGCVLTAPIPRPPKNVICLGGNYGSHHGVEISQPVYFSKAVTAVVGPGSVTLPDASVTTKFDYEAELAVVIGIGGRSIPHEAAIGHVFGYTIVNDLSARDLQHERPGGQWFLGKSLDGACPMGPWVVTSDEIPDPQNLAIGLRINGQTMQDDTTGNMIHGVADIIADLSHYLTLEPGDVIATGTPGGIGSSRQPPRFLRVGDELVAFVQGLGELVTTITERGAGR